MGDIVRVVRKGRFLGWYVRYRDSDGRRKQRASHQQSKAEARRFLLAIEGRVARGLVGIAEPAPAVEGTVAELCERYLREFSSPKIKDLATFRACAATAVKRLLPWLGRCQLDQLTRENIEAALREAQAKYRANTVRTSAAKLQAVLSWAAKRGIIARSPAVGIEKPPRQDSLEHLTPEEAGRLLAELAKRSSGKRQGLVWQVRNIAATLALRLGLRRGEIFGLRWQDLDLARQRLTVARSYRGLPKSNKPRHLPLPADLAATLQTWRERCPPTPEGLLCPVYYGGTWHMSTARAHHGLAATLRAAGCRPLTRGWHALRHTMASHYMMQGGNILALSKILGHTDVKQTLVYAHLAPDYLGKELERVRY